mgnify:FL=1
MNETIGREEYRQFTKPAELHKAINMLRGIVAGISSSGDVSQSEIEELANWCLLHTALKNRHPFSEIIPVIEKAISDNSIDDEERQNILWLCNNFADNSSYYNIVTSSIQFLHGLIHGIMADSEISDSEIQSLTSWIDTNDYLQGTYPFDELNSLLHTILEDGEISEDERNTLLAFCSNIVDFRDSVNLNAPDFEELRKKYSVAGVCAYCPDISFDGKLFCFTGESYRATRAEMKAEVEALGGAMRPSVTTKTDYLIVGNAGNPCWAYACYGRKIEDAMNIRKDGGKVQIINETDFWDAVWDEQANSK